MSSVTTSDSLKGLRILSVEDNLLNQKLICLILRKSGCAIDTAENGIEAIEKMTQHQYDICLMDIQMPEMSGVQATQILRTKYNIDIPIIAITAAGNREDFDRLTTAGIDDIIAAGPSLFSPWLDPTCRTARPPGQLLPADAPT